MSFLMTCLSPTARSSEAKFLSYSVNYPQLWIFFFLDFAFFFFFIVSNHLFFFLHLNNSPSLDVYAADKYNVLANNSDGLPKQKSAAYINGHLSCKYIIKTENNQRKPDVSELSFGGFVVVWESNHISINVKQIFKSVGVACATTSNE